MAPLILFKNDDLVALKKQDFLTNIKKISNLFILEGGHTAPPLRLYLRLLQAFIGEPLSHVGSRKKNHGRLSDNIHEIGLFAVQS